MTDLEPAPEPPELDDEKLPEPYIIDGDTLVFQTPGSPAEWIQSDLTITPPDAGAVDGNWETARDELGER